MNKEELENQLRSLPQTAKLSNQRKQDILGMIRHNNRRKSIKNWYVRSMVAVTSTIVFLLFIGLVITNHAILPFNNQASQSKLVQVNGYQIGFTYSEYFKGVDELDKRTQGTYYKPLDFTSMMQVMPEKMNANVHLQNDEQIPFDVDEKKAFLVTSEDQDGDIVHQVQFTYKGISSEQFFIVSMTEVNENPLANYDFTKEDTDSVGNPLLHEELLPGVPLFQIVRTSPSALVYSYYDYTAEDNTFFTVGTNANEIYTYYNGYVYHFGYNIKPYKEEVTEVDEDMVQLARKFILGEQSIR
ncbi:hypothetical protein [Radiobacillus sp. PE A8.2]|uniref:hypothetical protein n=1 Tax=Radiobacillus sp. PE A8.2 TaxID=3380349 RepID=UPI00388D310D